ncbi:MAG: acyl-CoA dehydrogenase family protein [Chloroflexia bacterium]|nr:acyl-CoA dehydrogenase family protein [Chloroflexia bacterium]
MEFRLTEEQRMLRDMVRDFADRELAPRAQETDEREQMDPEAIRKMAELGLLGMVIPEEYGGLPMDPLSIALALEEIARACGSTGLALEAHTGLGVLPLVRWGTPEQQQRFLPRMAEGKSWGCLALTEPGAGSDLTGIRTTAVQDGEEWVINGTKAWITNASLTDVIIVLLRTDPDAGSKAFSMMLVETDRSGLTIEPHEKKMGLRGAPAHGLTFEDVRVPRSNLLGQRGRGLHQALKVLDTGRVAISALAVGLAQRAYEEARRYALEREAFGRPIAQHQAVQFKLADMATQIHAGRLMLHHAAWLEGQAQHFTQEAAMAKLFTSEMAERVAYEALQIHGGYGYSKEYAVERVYRDVRLMTIGEGTSEILRLVIGRHVLQEP